MGAVPQTKNRLVALFDSILDGLLNGLAADAIYGAAVGLEPWLAWPIISFIAKYAIGKITQRFYELFEPGGAKMIITFQTNQERDANIAARNQVFAAKQSGDANAISEAKKKYNATLDALIHSDGS